MRWKCFAFSVTIGRAHDHLVIERQDLALARELLETFELACRVLRHETPQNLVASDEGEQNRWCTERYSAARESTLSSRPPGPSRLRSDSHVAWQGDELLDLNRPLPMHGLPEVPILLQTQPKIG